MRPRLTGDRAASFDWREWCAWIESGKVLKHKFSRSHEQAEVTLGAKSVILATFSDQHIGAWGSDYHLFRDITQEIIGTPNLYVALLGDETETAIKLRSVVEVTNQVLPPEAQTFFLEAWLEEIKDKVAFATWSNHSVERQEALSGESSVKRALASRCTYFNGIGHADLLVGKQEYTVAASHVFRGKSAITPNAGVMRYLRNEGQDREIGLQGDLHVPAITQWIQGELRRVAITTGSLHTNSGYAKRYFSLHTHPAYPCVVLDHSTHNVTPFWSIREAARFLGPTS